jgi:glutamate-ammonia-ligase adenylyltransferase
MIGTLYDIDLRLRPDGKSGLMVTRLSTYASYLEQDAWTWELQALVRARPVYGVNSMQQRLTELRAQLLQRQRDQQQLRDEVLQMRAKMRQHLLHSSSDQFDLKQGVGGITDIEFLVQYLVLRFSAQHPQLVHYTDNIRILEQAAACSVLSNHDAQQLIDAYLAYRAEVHRLALDNQPALTSKTFSQQRSAVQQLWQQFFSDTDRHHLG